MTIQITCFELSIYKASKFIVGRKLESSHHIGQILNLELFYLFVATPDNDQSNLAYFITKYVSDMFINKYALGMIVKLAS